MSANPRLHHPSRKDTPLSITNHQTNKTYYYHRNHQGSIIALTDYQGYKVEEIVYHSAYGEILLHTKAEETFNPYGYTGREIDLDDLYYYRARYYVRSDQQTTTACCLPLRNRSCCAHLHQRRHIERFISQDPIEFEAGDINFYRYVGNDPVNFVDPSGLENEATAGDIIISVGKGISLKDAPGVSTADLIGDHAEEVVEGMKGYHKYVGQTEAYNNCLDKTHNSSQCYLEAYGSQKQSVKKTNQKMKKPSPEEIKKQKEKDDAYCECIKEHTKNNPLGFDKNDIHESCTYDPHKTLTYRHKKMKCD